MSALNTSLRHRPAQLADALVHDLAGRASFHSLEDEGVGALQGQVELRADRRLVRHQVNERVGDVGRVNGAQAQAEVAFDRGQLRQQFGQTACGVRQVRAVGADVHAADYQLAVAVHHQPLDLAPDHRRRERAVRPASFVDDAKGAALIAALLDLHEGAHAAFKAADQLLGEADFPVHVADLHYRGRRRFVV